MNDVHLKPPLTEDSFPFTKDFTNIQIERLPLLVLQQIAEVTSISIPTKSSTLQDIRRLELIALYGHDEKIANMINEKFRCVQVLWKGSILPYVHIEFEEEGSVDTKNIKSIIIE